MDQTKNGKPGLSEVIKFLVSGGICFLVKLVCSLALKFGLGHETWLSVLLAELVAIAANYVLCVLWIWPGSNSHHAAAKIGFLITSLIGLGLNELLMLLFRLVLGEDAVIMTLGDRSINMYVLNKCLATLIVMIWNYFSKRAVLYRKAKQ